MRIIVTKRNYQALITFVVILIIFLFVRFYYKIQFLEQEDAIDNVYKIYHNGVDNTDFKLIDKKTQVFYDKKNSLEWQFGFIIIFFSIVSFFTLINKFSTLKNKIKLFFFFAFSTWLIFAITQSKTDCDTYLNVYKDDNYFISLLFLIPFLYFIYKETFVGIKEDITEDVKIQTKVKHEDNLSDLNKLLEMELITKDEYISKKEIRVKEKLRLEIKETEEYELLLKSKQKGLLSEDEFKNKVESLIDKKFNAEQ